MKKVSGQKTNLKHNGIIAFVSNTVQKLLQNASQFLQSSDFCPVKRSEDALDTLAVMAIIQGDPFLKTWKSAPASALYWVDNNDLLEDWLWPPDRSRKLACIYSFHYDIYCKNSVV